MWLAHRRIHILSPPPTRLVVSTCSCNTIVARSLLCNPTQECDNTFRVGYVITRTWARVLYKLTLVRNKLRTKLDGERHLGRLRVSACSGLVLKRARLGKKSVHLVKKNGRVWHTGSSLLLSWQSRGERQRPNVGPKGAPSEKGWWAKVNTNATTLVWFQF